MQRTIESLPDYLRQFTVEQSGDKYTAKDQASWRYIMRQSRAYFKDHAVPIYLEGLKRTGITLDRIPLIADMDARLRDLGWGAVPVCGFIPPAAFLDFQARRILPIAFDMRSTEHIAYTPAPDIVHEAAGHAPILADRAYSDYLTMYATMAQKAIFSQEDLDLYEAIRTLSDVKENPDSTPALIDAANAALTAATARVTTVSEAAKVARMNWWTVEYGLLGSLAAPKIYGAGLLSSVSESQACLTAKVKKLRLSVACTETAYNITEPQPQLFVADDLGHLTSTLKEFERTLAYVRGGIFGLDEARRGATVTTTVLDSGLSVSGKLEHYDATPSGSVEFVRFSGPVQLAVSGRELAGQGVANHPHGFSTPLGRFAARADVAPSRLTGDDLARLGLVPGQRAELVFVSGIRVAGELIKVTRDDGRLVVLTWKDCRVDRGAEVLYQPEWGTFDMGIGEAVVSVCGGPADRGAYGNVGIGKASTTPSRRSPFTADEKRVFAAYAEIRASREAPLSAPAALALATRVARDFPDEWLLRLEALELTHQAGSSAADRDALAAALTRAASDQGGEVPWLVRQGTMLAPVPDRLS